MQFVHFGDAYLIGEIQRVLAAIRPGVGQPQLTVRRIVDEGRAIKYGKTGRTGDVSELRSAANLSCPGWEMADENYWHYPPASALSALTGAGCVVPVLSRSPARVGRVGQRGLLLLSSLLSRYVGFRDYAAVAVNARLGGVRCGYRPARTVTWRASRSLGRPSGRGRPGSDLACSSWKSKRWSRED